MYRNAISTTESISVVHGFKWHAFNNNTHAKKIWSGPTVDSIGRRLLKAQNLIGKSKLNFFKDLIFV